ncbi:MAG: hypothetical protein J5685_10675 [Clostridiales bacterium]|nr:hypothetical protein [Clostridiales bacterium]
MIPCLTACGNRSAKEPSGSESETIDPKELTELEYNEMMADFNAENVSWASDIFDRIADDLISSGDIAESIISDEEYFAFTSDDGPAFLSDDIRDRYTSSDFVPDGKVICANYNIGYDSERHFYVYSRSQYARQDLPAYDCFDTDEDTYSGFFADSREECSYLIVIAGLYSNIDRDFYEGGTDRYSMSTDVYIIDVRSMELVHVEHIGDDCPGAVAQVPRGRMLEFEAQEYIRGLLAD